MILVSAVHATRSTLPSGDAAGGGLHMHACMLCAAAVPAACKRRRLPCSGQGTGGAGTARAQTGGPQGLNFPLLLRLYNNNLIVPSSAMSKSVSRSDVAKSACSTAPVRPVRTMRCAPFDQFSATTSPLCPRSLAPSKRPWEATP